MHPNQDVLLCWSASRQKLGSSHGYPLRVVIPGHVAARWVKWLRGLRISRDENDSPPMKDDYKILRPPVNATEEERRQWVQKMMGEEKDVRAREEELHKAKPLMRLGVGSGLSTPVQGQRIGEVGGTEGQATLEAAGYAVGTEGESSVPTERLCVCDPMDDPLTIAPPRRLVSQARQSVSLSFCCSQTTKKAAMHQTASTPPSRCDKQPMPSTLPSGIASNSMRATRRRYCRRSKARVTAILLMAKTKTIKVCSQRPPTATDSHGAGHFGRRMSPCQHQRGGLSRSGGPWWYAARRRKGCSRSCSLRGT